ncbi:hypothetical protein PT974_08145 [Cladobotryum mycophilum]|uniref:Uncharacterized protein n=1 Tax=Cladobotryum mycophilum TaxID=491253 RepID=A0ABR0SCI8_9HYPO
MDDAVAAMGRMGLWLQETKSLWSLSAAMDRATTTETLREIISPRLSVHIVFLLQQEFDIDEDKRFDMDQNDVNTFIRSLFDDDEKDCEWTCEHKCSSTVRQVGISEVSRWLTVYKIKLYHDFHRSKDSLQSAIIRDLCTKLVGLHQFSTYSFQVVPEWGPGLHLQRDDQRRLGSYLILMQLGDIYDRYLLDPNLDVNEKRSWAEQALELSQCFVRQYGRLLTFSSDEELESTYSRIKLDLYLGELATLLCQLAEAMSSSRRMLGAMQELKKVPMDDLINLVVSSMMPVYNCGIEVQQVNDNPELGIEHLVRPLRGVLESNTILSCAVSTLATNMENNSRTQASWTLIGFLVCSFGFLIPRLVFFLGFLVLAFNFYKLYETVSNTRRVDKMNEFSTKMGDMTKDINQVGISGACGKLHLLVVLIKAGSSFDKDTPEYECYRRLLDGQFGVEAEREDQINELVRRKTAEMCQSIFDAREMIGQYARKHGILPEYEG